MGGRDDAGAPGEAQGDLLPGLHAVVVGLLGELRERETAVLIDDGRLGTRAPKRRPGREYDLEILIRLLIAQDALRHGKETPEFDQGGHARAERRLKHLLALPAEAERAKAGLIGDAKEIVTFGEGPDRAAFALGEAPL